MLGLVAAQLKHRTEAGLISQRPVWVDVRDTMLESGRHANIGRLVEELDTSNCA
jgi:hypothetical protein